MIGMWLAGLQRPDAPVKPLLHNPSRNMEKICYIHLEEVRHAPYRLTLNLKVDLQQFLLSVNSFLIQCFR